MTTAITCRRCSHPADQHGAIGCLVDVPYADVTFCPCSRTPAQALAPPTAAQEVKRRGGQELPGLFEKE